MSTNYQTEPKILYEDEALFVIEKPAGWIVNEATTTKNQPVLQTFLRKFNYPLVDNEVSRHGIVHRLDKGTSGLIVAAKNDDAHRKISAQFAEHQVQKKYLTLTMPTFSHTQDLLPILASTSAY